MSEPIKPEEITRDTFPKIGKGKVPILAGLPAYLKDHDNYIKIRGELFNILRSNCMHREDDLLEWGKCLKCQIKVRDHADFLRKLGFTSPAQYYAWRKVHEHIDNPRRDKLR